MNQIEKNNSWLDVSFTGTIVLAPILNVYSIGNLPIGLFFLLFFSFCLTVKDVCKHQPGFVIDNKIFMAILPLLALILCSIISLLYEPCNYLGMLGRILFVIFYSFILIQARVHFKYEIARKTLMASCVAVVIGLMAQLTAYYLTGMTFNLFIPGLKTTIEGLGESHIIDNGFYRPKSLFNESSHAAYFVSVGLLIVLFYSKEPKPLMELFLTLGLLLSVSGTGIMLSIIIWGVYLSTRKKSMAVMYVLLSMIVLFIIVTMLDLHQQVIYSFERIFLDGDRVTGLGFYFKDLNLIERIFGVGMGNVTERFSFYFTEHSSFMNGFGRTLIEGGIFSMIIFLLCYSFLILRTKFPQKAPIILFFVLNFADNIYFGSFFTFILAWMFLTPDAENSGKIQE